MNANMLTLDAQGPAPILHDERPGMLARIFQPFAEPRSYGNLVFLALAFPLGLAEFIFLLVGFSLGLGLSVIMIGIPIVALMMAAAWGLCGMERQLAIRLLGAPVGPRTRRPLTGLPILEMVREHLTSTATWKGLAYLMLRLPLGIVAFIAVVFGGSVSAALLAAPVLYHYESMHVFGMLVDTLPEALLCFAAGLLFAVVALHALNGLAKVWARFATLMLTQRQETAPAA